MSDQNPANAIELRVEEISQLFDTFDPFPFREKDLDKNAEEYIVGWARELPRGRPIRIVIHFLDSSVQRQRAKELPAAFHRFFEYRMGVIGRNLNELFRIGRRSLGIGFTILAICLVSAQIASEYLSSSAFVKLVEESFLILGWVANWRPLEIFLYDWWPLVRQRHLYRLLSTAPVDTIPYRLDETEAD
jgi:hypothetical protein